MKTSNVRRPAFAAAVLLLAAVVFLAADHAPAPAQAPAPKPVDRHAGQMSFGIGGCKECHQGPRERRASEFAKYGSATFVRLNESATWSDRDVHAVAYDNLKRPLGERMGRLLGYDVTKAAQCLTCHSADLHKDKPLAQKTRADFATSAGGVNCTVCHGLGGNWQIEHFADPQQEGDPLPWRLSSPDHKYDRGMENLRDPVVKARLCASCHVGNEGEGKVVTHEMYAAGHPPLPPFELASFMNSEPNHWGYPNDPELTFLADFAKAPKNAEGKPTTTWDQFRFHPADKESYLARHLATGAIAALEAEMRLVAAEAKADSGGVDYARFDCYACHHDLKTPSERQKRGFDGPPGRPPLKAWVGALPGIVAEHARGLGDPQLKVLADDFGTKWRAVRDASLGRPFGDPTLEAKAGSMAAWCDEFLARQSAIGTPLYGKDKTDDLLKRIAAALPRLDPAPADGPKVPGAAVRKSGWAADPEAAMHLTWAYTTLRADRKLPLSAEDVRALGAVIPVRVRGEPDSYRWVYPKMPTASAFRDRMELFNRFKADDFERALLKLAPDAKMVPPSK